MEYVSFFFYNVNFPVRQVSDILAILHFAPFWFFSFPLPEPELPERSPSWFLEGELGFVWRGYKERDRSEGSYECEWCRGRHIP